MFDLLRPRNAPRFRPPAEADSLVLQVDCGCPHNACAFCGMYKEQPYRRRPPQEVASLVAAEARAWPDATRVFLADGDPLLRPFAELEALLRQLSAALPRLARVNAYATGRAIAALDDTQLAALRALKLHTLYLGLESGDESLLQRMAKGERAADMVRAGQRAAAAGLRISVMVLLGLGGPDGSDAHARASAAALNDMQPALLSLLRVIPVPGTPLWRWTREGRFVPLSEHACVTELRALIAGLELRHTVLRANHASNLVPLEGRLPRDRAALLAALDMLLAGRGLSRTDPGDLSWQRL